MWDPFVQRCLYSLTHPSVGSLPIPTPPSQTIQVALVQLVPVHGTCHMIPGQQYYPVPFWTALTQSRHLMNVYWWKEWMMNKSNPPSWVRPDQTCLLKTKFSEWPKTMMTLINITGTRWWPSSSSAIFNLHVKSEHLASEEKDSNILHTITVKIAQGLLPQGTCIHPQ